MPEFTIISCNVSAEKGIMKTPAAEMVLEENHGAAGDAHAGPGERQVSLLAQESIYKMHTDTFKPVPGNFAENITTRGINLHELPIGTRLRIKEAELEITRIGKTCHKGCAIREAAGTCIMPTEGVFAKVIQGGIIHAQDNGYYTI